MLCSILTTHIQKENLPAYEWLGNHCCGSLGLAGPWELSWAGATMAHALQRCAEAAGETALPHRGLSLARSTLPPPLVATHLCSFPPQGVFHSSIITQTN